MCTHTHLSLESNCASNLIFRFFSCNLFAPSYSLPLLLQYWLPCPPPNFHSILKYPRLLAVSHISCNDIEPFNASSFSGQFSSKICIFYYKIDARS